MYDILKAIAASNDWPFIYARQDWQNLYDDIEKKNVSYVFLDPVERDKVRNDTNVVEAIIYSGRFMIVRSSDIDEESYDDRYQDYIKPILEADILTIEEALSCVYEVEFSQWKIIELINFLDYNLDGLIVNFNITEKV